MDQLRSQLIRTFQRGARLAGVALALVIAGSAALWASLDNWRSTPLTNTLESPQAVGEVVLSSLRAGQVAPLRDLALTEHEFRDHVWPGLPASRTDGAVPFNFVWGTLRQNSEARLHETIAQVHGQELTLKRVEFEGPSTSYGDVTVHRESRLVVETREGRERTIRLFGSMIEQDGRWKVFSYVID